MNRRTLLAYTALLPVAACAGTAAALTPAAIVKDAQSVITALTTMEKTVVADYPNLIPPATQTIITTDLGLALGAAGSLNSNLPAASSATTVQTVLGYLNTVLNTLAAPPINGLIPAPFNEVVAAAALIAPELEAFVTSYIPTASAAVATVNNRARLVAAAPTVTTLAQARNILAQYQH